MMYSRSRFGLGFDFSAIRSAIERLKEEFPVITAGRQPEIFDFPAVASVVEVLKEALPYVPTAPVASRELPGAVADILTDDDAFPGDDNSGIVSAGLGGSLPLLLAVAVGAYFLLRGK